MIIRIPVKKVDPPRKPRVYTASEEAVIQARKLGLGGDVAARLRRMARRAAPITHDEGNRRFEEFVLLIEDNEVKAVNRL